MRRSTLLKRHQDALEARDSAKRNFESLTSAITKTVGTIATLDGEISGLEKTLADKPNDACGVSLLASTRDRRAKLDSTLGTYQASYTKIEQTFKETNDRVKDLGRALEKRRSEGQSAEAPDTSAS